MYNWSQISNKIYPRVKEVNYQRPLDKMPHIKLPNNLAAYIAIDTGDTFKLMFYEDIPSGVSVEQLITTAQMNLENNYSWKFGEDGSGVYAVMSGMENEASILCNKKLLKQLSTIAGGDLLMIAPGNELCYAGLQSNHFTEVMLSLFQDEQALRSMIPMGFNKLCFDLFHYNSKTEELTSYK